MMMWQIVLSNSLCAAVVYVHIVAAAVFDNGDSNCVIRSNLLIYLCVHQLVLSLAWYYYYESAITLTIGYD
jgi:uncharacterized membrane protein